MAMVFVIIYIAINYMITPDSVSLFTSSPTNHIVEYPLKANCAVLDCNEQLIFLRDGAVPHNNT